MMNNQMCGNIDGAKSGFYFDSSRYSKSFSSITTYWSSSMKVLVIRFSIVEGSEKPLFRFFCFILFLILGNCQKVLILTYIDILISLTLPASLQLQWSQFTAFFGKDHSKISQF